MLNAAAGLASVRQQRDICFAPDHGLSLDVYTPQRGRGPLPTVVFFYGGGWDSGFRAMYRFVGAALAARGFAVVIPDYRVYPAVCFPEFLRDAAAAVRWTVDNIAELGGAPGRLVLAGHSAGAHIAAMLAFDRQWLDAVGLAPDRALRGLVGLSGPYDFLPLESPTLKIIFGPEPERWASQPINFVDRPVVPSFLAAGKRDRRVDPANSVRLAKRIETRGGAVELKLYPRTGHELLIGAFSPLLAPLVPVLADVTRFVANVTDAAPAEIGREMPA